MSGILILTWFDPWFLNMHPDRDKLTNGSLALSQRMMITGLSVLIAKNVASIVRLIVAN